MLVLKANFQRVTDTAPDINICSSIPSAGFQKEENMR